MAEREREPTAADEVDFENYLRSGMDIRRFSDQPFQDNSFNTRESALDSSNITVVGDGSEPLIPYRVDDSKTMSTSQKYLAFTCFCIAEFNYGAAYSSMYLYFPAVASAPPFNISQFWIGLIIAMTGIGGIISAFFYQLVLGLGNRKQLYVISNLLVGALTMSFGFLIYLPNDILVIGSAMTWKFCTGFSRIGIVSLGMANTSVLFEGDVASKVSILISSLSAGVILGPVLASFLFTYIDYQAIYLVIGAGFIINIAAFWTCIPAHLKNKKRSGTLAKTPSGNTEAGNSKLIENKGLSNIEILIIPRTILNLLIELILMSLLRETICSYSIYLTKEFNVSPDKVGLYYNISAIIAFLQGLLNSACAKRIDTRILIAFFGCLCPCLGYFMITQNCWAIFEQIFFFIEKDKVCLASSIVGLGVVYFVNATLPSGATQELIKGIKRKTGGSITVEARDKVSNFVTSMMLLTWCTGPILFSVLSLRLNFEEVNHIFAYFSLGLTAVYCLGAIIFK